MTTRRRPPFRQKFRLLVKRLSDCVQGSQIVELAIALPFMMVLLVGIFDFGQAFNTKQKINTAAREAARYGANQSTLDWSAGTGAPSILTARNMVDAYLLSANLNDCNLAAATPSFDSTSFKWTFTSKGSCPTNLVLVVERATTYSMTNGTNVVATKVTITYPLQWHFSSIMKVLLPASNYPGPVFTITSNAVMANLS